MCGIEKMLLLVVMVMATGNVFCAPVGETNEESKRSADSPAETVVHQDEDLQDLMNLVHTQETKDNVMVHKHEMTHLETNNGETSKVMETKEQVVDTKSGKVIADVTQEVKQEDAGNGGNKPETVVETKVDIPSEGVHQTIVQNEDPKPSATEESEDGLVDQLTPTDMAEFLLTTRQFDLFYTALEKLVNQSKMTVAEAQDYVRVVALEYQRLEMEELEAEEGFLEGGEEAGMGMPLMERRGQLDYQVPQWQGYPGLPDNVFMAPEDNFLSYLQQQQQQMLQQQQQQLLQQQQQQQQLEESYLKEGELNPYDFLTALWEEAYDKGNDEAREIVQLLYDRVSQDENTDDIGQIRDILVDSVATSLANQASPGFESQPLEPQVESQPLAPEADTIETKQDTVGQASAENEAKDTIDEEAKSDEDESKTEEEEAKPVEEEAKVEEETEPKQVESQTTE